MIDDSAQPGDFVFRAGGTGSLRVGRRLLAVEAGQLEVGVGVHEAGNDGHVPQVEVAWPFAGRTHPADPALLDADHPVLDGRALYREHVPRLEDQRVSSHRSCPLAAALRTTSDPMVPVGRDGENAKAVICKNDPGSIGRP